MSSNPADVYDRMPMCKPYIPPRPDNFYEPQANVKPEWRHIHEDRCFDFSEPTVDEICNDPEITEFSNVDIDVSDELLEMLISRTCKYLEENVMPCSMDIWQQKSIEVEDVPDLQKLFGECMINDQLVTAIIAGCALETGWRMEPYYNPEKYIFPSGSVEEMRKR